MSVCKTKYNLELDHRFAESDFPWALSLSEEEIKTVMKVSPIAIDLETKLYKFYASMKVLLWHLSP